MTPLRPRAGRPPRRPRTAARQTLRRPSTPPSSPPCSGVTRGSFQVTSQGPGGPACSQSTPSVPPAPAARATRGPVVSARSPPPPPAWPLPAGPSRCTRFGHTEAPKLLPALPGSPLPTSLPRPRGPSAGPRRPQTLRARPPSCPPRIARQLECAEENRGPGRPCTVPEARRQPPGELGELGPLLHDAALCSLLEALATVPILGPHRGEPQLPASAPSAHLPLPDPGAPDGRRVDLALVFVLLSFPAVRGPEDPSLPRDTLSSLASDTPLPVPPPPPSAPNGLFPRVPGSSSYTGTSCSRAEACLSPRAWERQPGLCPQQHSDLTH